MSKRNKNSDKHTPQARSESYFSSALPLSLPTGALIIAFAVFIVYFPSLNGGFILDDDIYVTKNQIVKASNGLQRFWLTSEPIDYYPVSNSMLWIEWRLWGRSTTGYHATNLILHIIESLMLWLILRNLSIPGAFPATLIFAVHPVNVESVAWISQRKEMMAMLFFLLSILWYLKSETISPHPQNRLYYRELPVAVRPSSYFYWLSLASFVLSMLSKGSVAMLPVLMLVIIWWLRPLVRRDLVRISPFFLVAAALTGVNVWFQTHGAEIVIRNAPFMDRLLGAGGVVWFYLYKAILPLNLAFVYPQWHIQAGMFLWWLPLIAAVFVTAVLWRYMESWSRPWLFAWGFFCISLAPVMGFADVGFMEHSLVADHYQHVAIIGVISLLSAGWSQWRLRSRAAAHVSLTAVAVAVVGIFALLSWRQNCLYSDSITLYNATLEKNQESWLVHNNLASELERSGRLKDAIDHCKQALRIKSDYAEAYNNLGVALAHTGLSGEAIENYREALRLKPKYPDALNNLAGELVRTGKPDEAIELCEQALRLNRDYPEAYNNLGIALVRIGKFQEGIECYREALRLKPDYPDACNNLGMILNQTGSRKEAIEKYERALLLKSDYAEAYNNLGVALQQSNRPEEAIKQYREALRQMPDYIDAHNNLGAALIQTGRSGEAIEHFKHVLRLKPNYINAWSNLAYAFADIQQPDEAIAASRKALELARSQGQTQQAKQIEDWLNSYKGRRRD